MGKAAWVLAIVLRSVWAERLIMEEKPKEKTNECVPIRKAHRAAFRGSDFSLARCHGPWSYTTRGVRVRAGWKAGLDRRHGVIYLEKGSWDQRLEQREDGFAVLLRRERPFGGLFGGPARDLWTRRVAG